MTFLREKAVNNEYHHSTRTFLFLNDDSELLGFFTLAFKIVKISQFDDKVKKFISTLVKARKLSCKFRQF